MLNKYEENYTILKEELKIPFGTEFGFSLVYSNGTKKGTKEQDISANVYVREIPTQYIDANITILSGFINVEVW